MGSTMGQILGIWVKNTGPASEDLGSDWTPIPSDLGQFPQPSCDPVCSPVKGRELGNKGFLWELNVVIKDGTTVPGTTQVLHRL